MGDTWGRQNIEYITGANGVRSTTNTTAVTGIKAYAIHCLTDTVFSALTETNSSGQALTGITISAGTVLYGRFTAYTLTSGTVRAYLYE